MLFGFSVAAEGDVTDLEPDPVAHIDVIGFQWSWQFVYSDDDITITGEPGEPPEMVLPVGQPVELRLISDDVNHAFWVPDFLSKRDLIPGVDNEISLTPTETGSYVGRCAEFCGLDHWRMNYTVRGGRPGRVRAVARRAGGRVVTTVEERPVAAEEPPEPEHAEARGLLAFLTSTDHKRIGISYMATAFAFYLIAGALAMVIRTELAEPGTQVVSQGRYNEMFTMHGSIMLFLFLGPFAFGLANYLVPLQVGHATWRSRG